MYSRGKKKVKRAAFKRPRSFSGVVVLFTSKMQHRKRVPDATECGGYLTEPFPAEGTSLLGA